jgi:hypothetical protein
MLHWGARFLSLPSRRDDRSPRRKKQDQETPVAPLMLGFPIPPVKLFGPLEWVVLTIASRPDSFRLICASASPLPSTARILSPCGQEGSRAQG